MRTLVITSLVASLLVLIQGCAKPPKVSATMDITRKSNDIVWLMLRIKNLEDRATTPITPEVIVQTRTGAAWDKPVSQIHPAAFVLNKKEQRDIFKVLHTNADLIRGTLTIKEQENGHVLMTQRFEKAVPLSSQPATESHGVDEPHP